MSLTQTFVAKAKDAADPVPMFKFWVEMKSIVVAEFKECTGLRLERATEVIEEGGVNDRVHYLPGRSKQSTITLKYGVVSTHELWNWYQKVLSEGKVESTTMSILLRDVKGNVVKCWNLQGAFPTKWEAPGFNVETSQAALESLEIAFDSLALDTSRTS